MVTRRSLTPVSMPPLPQRPAQTADGPDGGGPPLGEVKWRENASVETLLQLEDFVARLHTWSHSDRVRRDITAAAVQSSDMMKALEARPQPSPRKAAYTDTMLDWDQQLLLEQLSQPEDEPELKMWEMSQRAFEDLAQADAPHGPAVWQRIGQLSARLNRVSRMLSGTKLHSAPLCDVVTPLMGRVTAMTKRPAVDYGSIESRVNEHLEEAAEVTRELINATADGEMEVAVARHVDKADLLERALDVLTGKYDLVADERKHYVRQELAELDRALRTGEMHADRLLRSNAQQRERRQVDLNTLHEQARLRLQRAEAEVAAQKESMQRSDAELQRIRVEQDVAWGRLTEQEAALRELAQQRLEAVSSRLKCIDRGRQHAAQRQAEENFYRRHRLLLRLSIENCDVMEEAIGVCKGFAADMHLQVRKHLDEFDAVLCSSVDEVDEQYDAVFRDLSVCLGDVIYKRDRKLHMLIATRDRAEAKREILSDRLDPEAKRYYEQAVECEGQMQSVADELAALRHRYAQALRVYRERAGDRLQARQGDQYVPPEEEVGGRNLQRRQRMVSIAAMLVDPDGMEKGELPPPTEPHPPVAQLSGPTQVPAPSPPPDPGSPPAPDSAA
eukprot:TRINITY_DN40683_c0_g1_i1.p2 TRINITY_DN40683_c0_g1~~TRINITY_DN40683_c0_g1_i1.p2  ORF type:complete len:616 (+),score=283.45 TRINITY_DN40683_c0_g1_i1:67-1914(+)